MLYKTICLQMIQERPEMYNRLLKEGNLVPTLERYAGRLKELHDFWKDSLLQERPNSTPIQAANEAIELALQDLEGILPSESEPDEDETFSLDAAMAFRRRMPTA